MFEGYLAFGGNEVANNERARGYAESAACPFTWFTGPRCSSLRDALGETVSYTYANITNAPWYDPSNPDISQRFYGAYVLGVKGGYDSSRQTDMVEGIDEGGVAGFSRKGLKEVTVKVLLAARDWDAVAYGVGWLSQSLDERACGIHGGMCGTADLAYFAACPPARAQVPTFTDWVETRRNLTNRYQDDITIQGGTRTVEAVSTAIPGVTSAVRDTRTSTGWTAVIPFSAWGAASGILVPAGTTVGLGILAWTNQASGNVQIGVAHYRASDNTFIGDVILDSRAASAVPATGPGTWLSATFTAGAVDELVVFGFRSNGGLVGEWLQATAGIMEARTTAPLITDYFDGTTLPADANPDLVRVLWDGAEGMSSAIYETRQPTTRPQTDEEYAADVDPLRRYLHGVATVAGPYETDRMADSSGNVALVMEYVLNATRPWVYAETRQVQLPVTPTTVIQDVAFNLAPYPSFELAAEEVTVATNLATNPSVETNATGWTAFSAGVAPAAVGARSTEIAADGVASYKVAVTTTNSGSAGQLLAYQDVPLAAAGGAPVSATIWAAAQVAAGTAVLGALSGKVEWRNGSGTLLSSTPLSAGDVAGAAMSAESLVPPVGATSARVIATAAVTSWSVGAQLALFADALAVTVP